MSKVTVKGVVYDVPEDLTFGETFDIETAIGEPLGGVGGFRRTASLVWIAMRRRDPSLTWEAMRDLKWDEVDFEKKDEPQEDEAVPPAQTAPHDEPNGVAV